MNFKILDFSVPSTDKIHSLAGVLYVPEGEIKGIFHLVHGMTEYIMRYEPLMSFLAQNGYLCVGFDNLGHGKTARNADELGFIAKARGEELLIDDVRAFADAVKAEYPDKPYILMGHSMGSFIARLAAARYKNLADKLIICGTGGPNPLAAIGIFLASTIKIFKGERAFSPFVEALAFGAYNKRFEQRTDYDWLTTDIDIVDRYIADQFCGFHFTVSALQNLITLTYNCNKKSWFKSVRKDLPILIISGDMDPVGDFGKGVKAVYDGLLNAGVSSVDMKLYEGCRHEIHNDTCKKEMADDILKFISE